MTKFDLQLYLKDPKTRPIILDGGLGSQLEDIGYDDDMNDVLWSTILLFKYPQVVKQVHKNFLQNGADVVTSNTYQASELGLRENKERLNLKTDQDIANVFYGAIELADQAREEFWEELQEKGDRIKPLVSVSIGPFGAYVADRSEYTGYYPSIENDFEKSIRDFHRLRLDISVNHEKVDFTMLETIPNFRELKALIDLIYELNPDAKYTISLSLKKYDTLLDGTDLKEVIEYLNGLPSAKFEQIIAIGTNCSPLLFSDKTVEYLSSFNDKGLQIIVYPNSGEVYDKSTRKHSADPLLQKFLVENDVDPSKFHDILQFISKKWVANGAKLVGGCCRITPEHIKWIHDSVL